MSHPGSSANASRWQAPTVDALQGLLPQYEVLDVLGRGGMGAVYKARQKSLKRLVAIKILPLEAAGDEMRFIERFKNEACTLAQMSHPGIVGVFDFGETSEGQLYFVMEFVDGTDVGQMIQANGRLPPDHARKITTDVCDALSYAHSNGVIHRDIKPANILINRQGQVKVADFGLAKMHDPAQTSALTRSNTAMGTPDYVAPEALSPGMVADHRADLYAVGVMLYQMLTGDIPRGLFKLPSERGIGSDPRFDEIICKAMEQDREERYQTAQEVRRALDEIATTRSADTPVRRAHQEGQEGQEGSAGIRFAASQPARSAGEVRTHDQEADRRAELARRSNPIRRTNSKRRGAKIGFIAAGLAAVIGTGAFLAVGKKKEPKVGAVTPAAIAEQPIDWLNAPPSFVRPWAAEWGLRDGVLTPSANDLMRQFGIMENGLVRLRVRMALGHTPSGASGPPLQLCIRSGPVAGQADRTAHVQFQTNVPNRTCSLHYQEKESNAAEKAPVEVLLKDKPLATAELDNEEVEWEFRAVGDEFSAWADGRLVASVRDARVPSGSCLLIAHAGIQITRLETVGLTPKRTSGPPTAPSSRTLSTNPENWTDRLGTTTWLAPWSMKAGALSSPSGLAWQELGQMTDGAIRVRARVAEGASVTALKSPVLQPTLRIASVRPGWQGSYQLQAYYPGRACTLIYIEREDKKIGGAEAPPVYLWKEMPLPPELIGKEEIEWEFRAVGDELSAWANGNLVASARDSRLSSGRSKIVAQPGIEITRLETSGSDVAKSVAAQALPSEPPDLKPPPILNWQDVTAMVREKALGTPGLEANGDGIRQTSATASASVVVTPSGQRDYALRVRYTKYVQVDLRTKPGSGFLFVFSQNTHTGFKRSLPGRKTSDDLAAGISHPAGFDPSQEHELLVTMQGTQIRAWLDGRFAGEAHDDMIKDGAAGVTFWPETVVHAVSIAELPAQSALERSEPPSAPSPREALPQITELLPITMAWRDVTDMVRERARGTPGLLVEEGMMRRVSPNQPSHIHLTPNPISDYAIRASFTNDVQVNLRNTKTGHLYVISQSGGVLVNRQQVREAAAERLANFSQLSDYDPGRPHEIVVTMAGEQIRIWLDGRFIGEARDEMYKTGEASLTFLARTQVHAVAVAELPSKGITGQAWQPLFTKPEDLGENQKHAEFRDGWLFLQSNSVLTRDDSTDGAIRATMPYHAGATGDLTIRASEDVPWGEESFACTAFISGSGTTAVLQVRDAVGKTSDSVRHTFPLPATIKEGEIYTLELRAEAQQLIVIVNGRKAGAVKDASARAKKRFGIVPQVTSATAFRDIAWQPLRVP